MTWRNESQRHKLAQMGISSVNDQYTKCYPDKNIIVNNVPFHLVWCRENDMDGDKEYNEWLLYVNGKQFARIYKSEPSGIGSGRGVSYWYCVISIPEKDIRDKDSDSSRKRLMEWAEKRFVELSVTQ